MMVISSLLLMTYCAKTMVQTALTSQSEHGPTSYPLGSWVYMGKFSNKGGNVSTALSRCISNIQTEKRLWTGRAVIVWDSVADTGLDKNGKCYYEKGPTTSPDPSIVSKSVFDKWSNELDADWWRKDEDCNKKCPAACKKLKPNGYYWFINWKCWHEGDADYAWCTCPFSWV